MRKSLRIFIRRCVILIFLLCHQALAENLKEHTQLWTNAQISGSITNDKKWKYYLEPQLRFLDDKYKFSQLNLYAGIYYQIISNVSFWAGIFRRYEQRSDGSTFQEYRLWEQVVWDVINEQSLKLTSRSRLEERKDFVKSQIAKRIRQKFTLKFPVMTLKDYHLVLADELFFQLNQPEWVTNRVFSENRASIGIHIPVSKRTSYEIGYLNQYQFGKIDQMSNVLYLTLVLDMDK